MKTIAEKKYDYNNSSTKRYKHERFMWRLRLFRYYKKMLKDADAVIICGGGFLKFRTQGLNYYVEMITEAAKLYDIPVMMNGVGIEGYDEKDIRCQQLKQHINMDCVKVITTRDDIDTLTNNYLVNPEIVHARVGDPALWTPECYNIKRNAGADVIGINTIRGNVYKDYGNDSSAEKIKKFYLDLIRSLEKRDLKWVMFSNGMKGDQAMGNQIVEELGLPEEKMLPAPETAMELLDMIKNFKCVFGARLHACITAYSLDVPVVGLIWNEKTRMFGNIIGKSDAFFEENEMDINGIIDAIDAAGEMTYDVSIRNELKCRTKKYIEYFLNDIMGIEQESK